MLLITSPFINFEVRSLFSFDVSNIYMNLIISFLIISILNILVANNKLVSNYWSFSHMYLYIQKFFSSNWCIYITYFFIFTYMMSFNFGLFFYDPIFLCAIVPIKSYSNAEVDKSKILKENKDKSGIYMWTNNNNKKRYIGSSQNLHKRFKEYFNVNYLFRNTYMYICRALLKHDYYNFKLEILEYCEPSKCLEREAFYQTKLNPEYNITKKPGAPMSGRTHSDDTKIIMSDAKKRRE